MDDATIPVRRFWEDVWSKGDADALDEIFAPDARENGEPMDLEQFTRVVARWTGEVFPDFTARIEELVELPDGRVLSRVTYTGTQRAPWAGLPATGRSFSAAGIDIFSVADGRIVELWHAVDHLELVLQLGGKIVPASDAP